MLTCPIDVKMLESLSHNRQLLNENFARAIGAILVVPEQGTIPMSHSQTDMRAQFTERMYDNADIYFANLTNTQTQEFANQASTHLATTGSYNENHLPMKFKHEIPDPLQRLKQGIQTMTLASVPLICASPLLLPQSTPEQRRDQLNNSVTFLRTLSRLPLGIFTSIEKQLYYNNDGIKQLNTQKFVSDGVSIKVKGGMAPLLYKAKKEQLPGFNSRTIGCPINKLPKSVLDNYFACMVGHAYESGLLN